MRKRKIASFLACTYFAWSVLVLSCSIAFAAPTQFQGDLRVDGGIAVDGPAKFARDAHFIGPLAVDGKITCKVITILGGMDVAEPVPVAANNLAGIAPGMVLSIDTEHPGALKLAAEPYDPKVAGVVSGANGIAPGLQLRTESVSPDASPHLLAIAGRIYVRATADNGSITPGDRLTTSQVPGVAMKATDPLRASGATLGKAMSGLNAGEGWVLMLVQPQ